MSKKKNKPTFYFRCISGVVELFDKKEEDGNILSFKNEIRKELESDENGYTLECVEGPNKGWDINFTLIQMGTCFEWLPDYVEKTNS